MKVICSILALAAALCAPAISSAETVDTIKAVVNDKVITYAEVLDYAREAATALRQQYGSQPEVFETKLKALIEDALDQLIERELILHSFDTEGYKLPDGVVDELVQEDIHRKFGDRVTLVKTLQARGMTFEQYRDQVRDEYIRMALQHQNVQREVIISPAKIVDYYNSHQSTFMQEDQVKLRMIVLAKSSPDDTNTVQLAQEIEAKLKGGANFTEMAGIYSQGSQQHQQGDWGWVEKSVLRKELAEVAFNLSAGQASAPIETPDSVYIMKVEDKKSAQARPLADVRNEIEKTIRTQQQADLQKKWIDGLKRKAFIRYIEQ